MTDWHTAPPPIGVELELETDGGKALTGQVSLVAAYAAAAGSKRRQYMLRAGGHPIFEVKRWRRVED